jgi:O-antigen/teichoic acid export membrane protein
VPSIRLVNTERFRRLFKEGTWIVVGQAAAVLGALVGVRLITELLDPAAYGELALGMTLATLVNQTVLGPIGNGITRFYAPAVEQDAWGSYFKAARQLLLMATGIIVSMVFLVVTVLVAVGRSDWIAITIAAFVLAILGGWNSILSGIQNAARQRSVVALHQGIDSWIRFLIAAGLMLWLGATSAVAMSGYALATILVLGSQFIFFRRRIQKNVMETNKADEWRSHIWQYSWPFATWGIFTWIQISSDRRALELFSTTQNVGYYAVLFQLGYYPISMVTGMANQFLGPIFFQRVGDARDKNRNTNVRNLSWRLTILALGMTSVAVIFAMFFHKQIFQLLVAKEYAPASALLPWIMLAGGIFAAGQTISLNLMSQLKTQAMISVKIITALIGIMLNFTGAYYFGIEGIISASILFSFIYFTWMALLVKKT